jgi:hypothetical protein
MDIVERLRGNADERLAGWQIVVIMHDAADEIERLRRIIWNLLDDGDETDRTEALAAIQQKDSE